MERVDGGDVGVALRRLGERHGRALWSYTAGLERDQGVVEEVVNDVLRIASVHLVALGDMSDGQVRGWLFRTASNLVANHARRTMSYRRLVERLAREPATSTASVEDEWSWSEDVAADRARSDRIRVTLAALREDYRLALVMTASGRSHAEIGAVLGVSENAARKRAMRARAAFREAYPVLADTHVGEGDHDG